MAPKPAVFFGWRVVAAAFTVLFVAYGIQFSFGVFVKEITDDHGLESRPGPVALRRVRGPLLGAVVRVGLGHRPVRARPGGRAPAA